MYLKNVQIPLPAILLLAFAWSPLAYSHVTGIREVAEYQAERDATTDAHGMTNVRALTAVFRNSGDVGEVFSPKLPLIYTHSTPPRSIGRDLSECQTFRPNPFRDPQNLVFCDPSGRCHYRWYLLGCTLSPPRSA